MVGRDVRRANVIIWSIANETVPSKKRNEFLKRLAQKARSLDSTRLISMAMEVTYLEDGTYTIKDELNTEVDIISFNEYFGWYVQPKDIPNALWRIPFDKPVIISEFGGGAVAGRHGGVKDRWSEEMQKDIYEKNVKMFGRIKNLSGTCPWILNDFRSPRRPLAGVQDGYNRKGLFAPDGSEKLAAGVMRKYYMREYYLREYFKTKRERMDR
jgi:beta-glucuronidase